jgi:hypothetical protein
MNIITNTLMARKKYQFLLGLVLLTTISVSGQDKVWADSSYYRASKLPQYNEFMNNLYAYPARPRSMWEVGVKFGSPAVSGDVSSVFPAFGWGLHVRKSLGYTLSLRMEYNNGVAYGLHWQQALNYQKNSAWTANGYKAHSTTALATDRVFYNYKTKFSDFSLQAVVSIGNLNFHNNKTKANFYGIIGTGVTSYDTRVNALNASGQKYNFNSIASGTWSTRNDVRDQLNQLLDDTYETKAESASNAPKSRFNGTLGAGVAIRLSRRLNVALEDRVLFYRDDLLDGQRWNEAPVGDATLTRAYDAINFLSLGLNINIF